ncbi:MAG TPA: M20/M25/M40 family metallo-hydrolase [Gemmatimonadaceae bacterium]|nr:M20/M25/M40 family metallo-hydrolase [Gemmatimonadaceae bacterium]
MIRALYLALFFASPTLAQQPSAPNWQQVEAETMQHFQALLRMDTSDPPGTEREAAEYLKQVLEKEGIPVEMFAIEPHRPNLVARLKGNGSKRPLLIMGHTDVVNVDPAKWTHPPFSATRAGGYVYGRGAVDDKDNVAAGLMLMLMLKRMNVPLDRDVIFLAEAGEEGTTRVGIQLMAREHFPRIEAEYCLAEGGGVTRVGGKVKYASVQTLEKIPRAIELTARGPSGHGSVPLQGNAVVRLANAVAKIGAWKAPVRLNEITRAYFQRLAAISPPDDAARYLAVIGSDLAKVRAADEYFQANEPRHAAMIRTSISPNIVQGGYRVNVIPSEAKATLDVRMLPGEDTAAFITTVKNIIGDTAIAVAYAARDVRPTTAIAPLTSEAFRAVERMVTKHYQAVTLPTMSTGATDMAYLRAKGMQCYGIGPATDIEDGPKGFAAHSDQERILESELHRFVRFQWDVVNEIAGARRVP